MTNIIKPDGLDLTTLQALLATDTVIESICNWNKARYEPVEDPKLSFALLNEEMSELYTAYQNDDHIKILDGLGDVFFVAIGVLWKRGISAKDIQELMDVTEKAMGFLPPPAVALNWYATEQPSHVVAILALSCLERLTTHLGDEDLALDVIRAICISNNSKEVVKTKPHEKANVNKGPNYKPPTTMLQAIYQKAIGE